MTEYYYVIRRYYVGSKNEKKSDKERVAKHLTMYMRPRSSTTAYGHLLRFSGRTPLPKQSKIFFGVIQATCRNYSNNFQLRKLEISAIRALSTFIWEVLLKSPYFCSSKLDCVRLPLTSSLFSKVGLSKSKEKKSYSTETPRFFSHLGNWLGDICNCNKGLWKKYNH